MQSKLITCAVVGVLGFAAARLTQSTPAAPPPATQPIAARTVTVPVAGAPMIDRDELRSLVREAVHAERDQPQRPIAEADAPAPPSPESLAAHQQALDLVASAKTSHVWTRDNAQALHALVVQLTSDQLQSVMQPLIVAINRDEIRTEPSVHGLF